MNLWPFRPSIVPRPSTPAAAVEPGITPAIPPRPWSTGVKWLVSGALLFHLTAQFMATWTAAPPASELGQTITEPFHFYIAAARLNQGYRFFAPNPEASNLLRFRIFDADGKPVVLNEFAVNADKTEGQLPPPELRVGLFSGHPRLLYHRYFMLTEQLAGMLPPALPPDAPPQVHSRLAAENQRREPALNAVTDSFARELLRRFGGARVEMQVYAHKIPGIDEVARGMTLEHANLNEFHPLTFKYPRPVGPSIGPR